MDTSVPFGGNPPRLTSLNHLGAQLMQLGSRSFAYFGAVATALGLPPPVAMALHRIEPERPGPMHELAGAMGCDPSYVTWLADQLEARGFAERLPAAHDRRVKVLALSPAGVAVREQLLARLAEPPLALELLSTAEAVALVDMLSRLLGDVRGAGPDHGASHATRPLVCTEGS